MTLHETAADATDATFLVAVKRDETGNGMRNKTRKEDRKRLFTYDTASLSCLKSLPR